MQAFGLVSILIVVFLGVWFVTQMTSYTVPQTTTQIETLDPVIQAEIDARAGLIVVNNLQPNGVVESPLTITGKARGYWFFEASFPVVLTDWDGRIIAESYASAVGEWMTEDFVPFTSSIEFANPYQAGDPDFMRRGTLILKRDNPSGLPENDDALEFPVYFAPPPTTTRTRADVTGAIDAAEMASDLMERP